MNKELAKQIHPLADETKPFVKIQFIAKDGKEHSFCSCVNSLSGDRLSWFDNSPPTINNSLKFLRDMIKVIKQDKIIEQIGKL